MTEKSEFKVPSADLKVLAKGRKSDLPASVSTVHISIPTNGESSGVDQFEPNAVEIPPIPYKEPKWSKKCDASREYSFEVEKNGVIAEEIKHLQSKPFWLFGRLPNCDINMAHPTISRYHAILQYRAPDDADRDETEGEEELQRPRHVTAEPGWYLYDLNSTHGTFLNKQQIPSRTYVRVRVGYMIKLGSSSRTYIFQGPTDDEEESLGLTITEMKDHIKKQKELRKEMAEIERQERERIERLKVEEGITWGMAEDADEETDLTENPYAASNNEELFLDDPKKTLRGYFEREGYDLEYKVDELSSGTYCCKVELPIDDASGRPIVAETTHKGKKKDVVLQCALEACRILDRHGLLRQANHEPRRRFQKQSDSDDDDDFLDRTGAVEKRRQRKESSKNPQTHTYADLIHREAHLLERLEEVESKIQNARLIKQETHLPENEQDVDKFLENLSKDKVLDRFEVRRLRLQQAELNDELVKVKKLIEITKPLDMEKIGLTKKSATAKRTGLPLFGKRTMLSNTFGIRASSLKAEKDVDVGTTDGEIHPMREATESAKSRPEQSLKAQGKTVPESKAQHSRRTEQSSDMESSSRKRSSLVAVERDDAVDRTVADSAGGSSSKKKRPRQRVRDGKARENVDFDDSTELTSEDKNVEWVPPSGQTGDGRTSLNEKYGY